MKKDLLIRRIVHQFEIKKLVYECLVRELPQHRDYFAWKRNSFPPQASKGQIRNRCVLTNRSRGVHRKFRLSRISIRELAGSGLLPGVTKSSW